MSDTELTICTVSFDSSKWLRMNIALARRLNPGVRFHWLIAENSAPDSPLRLDNTETGFDVVQGAERQEMPYGTASYHHAAGLGIILERVSTRYVLVLDPDFFIVRENWIRSIIDHMKRRSVAILGAPWHPGRASKIRYFPCAHCMFIDLEQIDKETLDFSPDYEDGYEDNSNWVNHKKARRSFAGRLLAKITFAKRRRIATSRDTGWRIYDRYRNDDSLKIECFQPVFRAKKRHRGIEALLPDHLSFIPMRPGYCRENGFEACGLASFRDSGWEEFFWEDQPLGFHVRCFPIRDSGMDSLATHFARVEACLEDLEAFVSK